MIPAYIALGSNLDNPCAQLDTAQELMRHLPSTHLVKISSYYQSSPVGFVDQPDFINAVAKVHTALSAYDLLECLQQIELKQGRTRTHEKNRARTLDLDILLFGERIIENDSLSIPHPRMLERAFVLIPLYEIAPGLHFPQGQTISFYCDKLPAMEKAQVHKISRSEYVDTIK